ncbi:MAG: flagellar biosynthesis protein FlhB [Myxococcota bacterium]
MAEDVEKTEKPTAKRREEARREGQVAVSREAMTLVNLLTVSLVLLAIGPNALRYGVAGFQRVWVLPRRFDIPTVTDMLGNAFGAALPIILPVLLGTLAAGILAGLAQTRGNVAWKKLAPKFSNLSPLSGARRAFGSQGAVELGKSVGKLAIAGTTLFLVIRSHLIEYIGLSQLSLPAILGFQLGTILETFLAGCAALLVIAIADYSWEFYRTEKSMRMTRSEVKDETRQSEGDPQVRARMRSLQMDRNRTRMLAAASEADVVVTNPDHFAVALAYRRSEMQAPKVVAKGRNILAARIREMARLHGVPIVENPPLARSLYRSVKVGVLVPERFYHAIAELLAYVYRIDRGRASAW